MLGDDTTRQSQEQGSKKNIDENIKRGNFLRLAMLRLPGEGDVTKFFS